jgi:hypothetical protein
LAPPAHDVPLRTKQRTGFMGDTFVWTGADTAGAAGGGQNLDDPKNWLDLTTNSVPTQAPQSNDIAEFRTNASGLYPAGVIEGGNTLVTSAEFDPATLQIGADVSVGFVSGEGTSTTFQMGTLQIAPGGSLAVGQDAALEAEAANIGAGATLDLSQAYWIGAPTDGPPGSGRSNAVRAATSLGYPGPLNAVVSNLTLDKGGHVVLGDAILGVSEFVNGNEDAGNAFNPAAGLSGGGTVELPLADAQQIEITGEGVAPSSPCFVAGTPIATAAGDVPAERLRPGDQVRTAGGRLAPVRWVGLQHVQLAGAPEAACPVRITADAIGPAVPRRDVLLSPDHAVLIRRELIPAHRLINGASIRRELVRGPITYVHVELDRHDVLLASGLRAESYMDTGNRGQFDGECGVRPLFESAPADPLQAAVDAYAARGCAPLHLDGDVVRRTHLRLLKRARALGWRLTQHAALSVTTDGQGARVTARPGMVDVLLAQSTHVVRLRSRSFVPADLNAEGRDGRRLGVAVALELDGMALPDAAFADGWHGWEADGAWRWTNGDAWLRLPPHGWQRTLTVRIMRAGGCYWRAPLSTVGEETVNVRRVRAA